MLKLRAFFISSFGNTMSVSKVVWLASINRAEHRDFQFLKVNSKHEKLVLLYII